MKTEEARAKYIGRPFRLIGHGMAFVCVDAYEFIPGKIAITGHNEDSTKQTTARVLDILWLDHSHRDDKILDPSRQNQFNYCLSCHWWYEPLGREVRP